jgi:hypothetical protein
VFLVVPTALSENSLPDVMSGILLGTIYPGSEAADVFMVGPAANLF